MPLNEEAVSRLAEQAFDAESFRFAFLEASGNKETTIRRLKRGTTNQSDLPGGVLQRNNIHIQVCPEGEVCQLDSEVGLMRGLVGVFHQSTHLG
jgi:hypothetical protein